jgi:NADH-quinone oxidoreductase subunit N
MQNFIFFLPEFFLIIILLYLCIFIPFFSNKNVYKYTDIINFIEIFIISNFLIYIYLNINSIGFNEHVIFNFIFLNNNVTIFLKIFIIFLSILILIVIKDHIKIIFKNQRDFYIIFFFSIISIVCLIMCFDLIFAALIIQLQNLAFYILFALNTQKNKAIEGSLKYFFLSSVGFGLYLFGVSLIYNFTGTTKINELYYIFLFENNNFIFEKFFSLGLLLICLSFFFKLSIAPFHF